MGMSLFKACSSAQSLPAPAPNPDPKRWQLLDKWQFPNAYVLRVRYLDCTNFEGVKVMVYRGLYRVRPRLDPHFSERATSPIARFRPDAEGLRLALALGASL